jgi:hypothetical protein
MSVVPFPGFMEAAWPVCSWNPSNPQGFASVGGANNTVATISQTAAQGGSGIINGHSNFGAVIGTVGRRTGKWYFEVALAGMNGGCGCEIAASPQINTSAAQGYYYGKAGYGIYFGVSTNGTNQSGTTVEDDDLGYNLNNYGPGTFSNAVVGVALDTTDSLIWWSVNGAWGGLSNPNPNSNNYNPITGNPAIGVGGISISRTIYYPGFQGVLQDITGAFAFTATLNASASSLVHTPPAGFSPWNSGPLQQ